MNPENKNNPLQIAVDRVGLKGVASACSVRFQNVQYWLRTGMPRTEFTGETQHASNIERAMGGQVTATDLLDWTRSLRKKRAAER